MEKVAAFGAGLGLLGSLTAGVLIMMLFMGASGAVLTGAAQAQVAASALGLLLLLLLLGSLHPERGQTRWRLLFRHAPGVLILLSVLFTVLLLLGELSFWLVSHHTGRQASLLEHLAVASGALHSILLCVAVAWLSRWVLHSRR